MLCRVAVVRADVSERSSASIISVTRIGELGTTLAVISNRNTLRKKYSVRIALLCSVRRLLVTANILLVRRFLSPSETSDLTCGTRRNITEDGILHKINRLGSVFQTLCVSYVVWTGGFISQKTAVSIVTAVKTSNLTTLPMFYVLR
jgi:hypothetical protein